MEFPTDRKYSKEHTWISVQDKTGIIGITEFAQKRIRRNRICRFTQCWI